ncbi:hypothetical protein [Pseudonocardia kujensis]|nr:hypothetical protein [Pseudonocardia kujensis]
MSPDTSFGKPRRCGSGEVLVVGGFLMKGSVTAPNSRNPAERVGS